MTDSPRLIGRQEAAAYCGISPTCFSMWVATHKMPPPIPGTRKWDRRAIDAKLDEISGLAPAEPEDRYEKWMRENGDAKGHYDLQQWREKKRERDEFRPLMKLDKKREGVLLFMSDHPECDTLSSIPGAGPVFMDDLIKAGAVRLVGTESGAFRYALTEEGAAEVQRIKQWRALAP